MKPFAPEVAESPYSAGDRSPEARAWRANAVSQEAYRRLRTGEYGAFTDQEMETARQVMGADPRVDPAAEILGIEPKPMNTELAAYGFTPAQVEALMRAMNAAASVFQQALDQIAAAFTASSDSIAVMVKQMEGMATQPKARHGMAAWCPKHGETRGGTCFRCWS